MCFSGLQYFEKHFERESYFKIKKLNNNPDKKVSNTFTICFQIVNKL